MRDSFSIGHEFVDRIPAERKERTLYVSIPFATAVHNCMCGCGAKIVTPISPPQWKVTFDGDTVSLWPSVGNSGLACRSHYWIDRDEVHWASSWSDEEIAAGRARDRSLRDAYNASKRDPYPINSLEIKGRKVTEHATFLERILSFFVRK